MALLSDTVDGVVVLVGDGWTVVCKVGGFLKASLKELICDGESKNLMYLTKLLCCVEMTVPTIILRSCNPELVP